MRSRLGFFKRGLMIAVFQLAAKTPLLIDVLIKWVIGLMMHGISFFNRVGGITSSSQHFGTCHSIVPFSSPILFSSIFVPRIDQAHQKMSGRAGLGVISCCVGGPEHVWCLGLGVGTFVLHQAVGTASDALCPNLLCIFTNGAVWSPSAFLLCHCS